MGASNETRKTGELFGCRKSQPLNRLNDRSWISIQVHGSDLNNLYGSGNTTEMQDYLVNLAYNLNPNGPTQIAWPKWKIYSPKMIEFLDGPTPVALTNDTYRAAAMIGLTTLSLKYPLWITDSLWSPCFPGRPIITFRLTHAYRPSINLSPELPDRIMCGIRE